MVPRWGLSLPPQRVSPQTSGWVCRHQFVPTLPPSRRGGQEHAPFPEDRNHFRSPSRETGALSQRVFPRSSKPFPLPKPGNGCLEPKIPHPSMPLSLFLPPPGQSNFMSPPSTFSRKIESSLLIFMRFFFLIRNFEIIHFDNSHPFTHP